MPLSDYHGDNKSSLDCLKYISHNVVQQERVEPKVTSTDTLLNSAFNFFGFSFHPFWSTQAFRTSLFGIQDLFILFCSLLL